MLPRLLESLPYRAGTSFKPQYAPVRRFGSERHQHGFPNPPFYQSPKFWGCFGTMVACRIAYCPPTVVSGDKAVLVLGRCRWWPTGWLTDNVLLAISSQIALSGLVTNEWVPFRLATFFPAVGWWTGEEQWAIGVVTHGLINNIIRRRVTCWCRRRRETMCIIKSRCVPMMNRQYYT